MLLDQEAAWFPPGAVKQGQCSYPPVTGRKEASLRLRLVALCVLSLGALMGAVAAGPSSAAVCSGDVCVISTPFDGLRADVSANAPPRLVRLFTAEANLSQEIAFAVVDEHQQRGIVSALAAELIVDARAAGITEVTALVSSDNPAAVALLRRIANVLDISLEGPELSIRAAIA